jgi:hypothetical protein
MNTRGSSRIFRTTLKDILKKPYGTPATSAYAVLTTPCRYDFVVRCDQFGHFTRTDPSRFPRTLLGGVFSLIFYTLAAATIGISIVVRALLLYMCALNARHLWTLKPPWCSSTTAVNQSHAPRVTFPAGTAWPLTLRQVPVTQITSLASSS